MPPPPSILSSACRYSTLLDAQRQHIDIDTHDAHPKRLFDGELDAGHDVMGDLADAQAVFEHDVDINRDRVVSEAHIYSACVFFGCDQPDIARPEAKPLSQPGAFGRNTHHPIAFGDRTPGDGGNRLCRDPNLAGLAWVIRACLPG